MDQAVDPPSSDSFSMRTTERPSYAASAAAASPDPPPPTTATSTLMSLVVMPTLSIPYRAQASHSRYLNHLRVQLIILGVKGFSNLIP